MIVWLLAVLCWVGYVARTVTVGRRRWHQPAELPTGRETWVAKSNRSYRRAMIPMIASLDAFFGLLIAGWGVNRFHDGIPAELCAVATLPLALVLVVGMVLNSVVHWLNRPRALVPPALRDDPGVLGNALTRVRRPPTGPSGDPRGRPGS